MPQSTSVRRFAAPFTCALFTLLLLGGVDPASAQEFGVGFGASAAVIGDHVLVGQPGSEQRPGMVFAYRWTGEDWSETGRVTAADGTPGDRFGWALAVSGDELIVGAPRADAGRGAAYVFRLGDSRFEQTAKLRAPGEGAGRGLGVTVAIDDDLALAGTFDGEILSMKGVVEGIIGPGEVEHDAPAVHAFARGADGAWAHDVRLGPDQGEVEIGFGHGLALDDGVAYVGAPKRNGSAGAVFVYRRESGDWTRTALIEGEAAGAGFGRAILSGGPDRLLVGAPLQDGQQGQVLALGRDGGSGEWSEGARLRPSGAGAVHFGYSLARAGDEVWIGGLGAAFSTSPDGDGWAAAERLTIERDALTEFFGVNVALSGDFGIVGFPEADYGAGSAAILGRADEGWEVRATVLGELDALPAVAGEEILCRDGTAGAFDCASVDLLAYVPTSDLGTGRGVQVNDIWGWTDPETGREYAIVGRNDGTVFVDVTDASRPAHVATMPRTAGSPASLWRDVKTYRNYALVVADASGSHGVQIFDLTRLRDLSETPATVGPDVTYDGVQSSHNIIVNEETGFAYAVSAQCGGGLHMIDLSDPLAPEGAGCLTHRGDGPLDGFSHDSQCVVYRGPDADFQGREICFTSALGGLLIQDVSDRENPVTLGVGQYPDAALPHQGWLTEDQRYFLLGDEGDEIQGLVDGTRTMIWDVGKLGDPVLDSEYIHPTRSIDHNMYVVGDLVYQANYDAGLRILDISDISAPREVGFFDTVPFGADEASFRLGAWSVYPYFESGTIIVSSGAEGLFLLRYTPREPVS